MVNQETRMTTEPGAPDRLREAAQAALLLFDHEVPFVGGERQDAFNRAAEALRAALAEAAPAPDLLAAVEALPGHDAWNTGVTRGDYVDRAAVLALIESRSASREAGLDAAVREFLKVWRGTTLSEATMGGPRYTIPPQNAQIIGEAVARLAATVQAASDR